MHIFEDYRKVYEFGRTWSYEEYGSTSKTLRDIRRDMHKQREWRNELERMKISNVVGCLYVDSKSLRNDLMPITTSTLDRIKLLLLNKSRETCMQVRDRHVAMAVEAHGQGVRRGRGHQLLNLSPDLPYDSSLNPPNHPLLHPPPKPLLNLPLNLAPRAYHLACVQVFQDLHLPLKLPLHLCSTCRLTTA